MNARRENSETERRILQILAPYLSPLTARSLLDSALERAGLVGAAQPADVARLLPWLERGGRLFMRSQADAEAAAQALGRLKSEPIAAPAPPPPPRPPSAPSLPASSPRPAVAAPAQPPPSSRRAEPPPSPRRALPSVTESPATGGPASSMSALSGSEGEVVAPSQVVLIRSEEDIVRARSEARRMAESLGASVTAQTQLATVVSELARNIVLYAGARGSIELSRMAQRGIDVVATDTGPGITDLRLVLEGNYRSKLGLGLGLRGVRRLASFFELTSAPGAGTRVHVQIRV